MNDVKLYYQTSPKVNILENTFINVPVILRYENTNLIEIIKEERFGYTAQFSVYHPDGTFLAKIKGNRTFKTSEGEKAGIKFDKYKGLWVCKMKNQILYEIRQQTGEAFKTTAELYTPDGYFIKCLDELMPHLIEKKGGELTLQGANSLWGNTFNNLKIGIWLKSDGSFSIG